MKQTAACHIKRHYTAPLSETLVFSERLCAGFDLSNGGDPYYGWLQEPGDPIME